MRGFSPALLALILGQVCLHSCMAGVRVAAPLLMLNQGHPAWVVGLLLGLFAAAPVTTSLRVGRMADRLGYHRPMHLAVALTASGGLLAGASVWLTSAAPHSTWAALDALRSLPEWCAFAGLSVAAMLCGVGANMGLITIQRTAGRLAAGDSTQVTRVFSWLGLAPALSNMIGPVLAGTAIDAAGFGSAFVVLSCLPLLALAGMRWVTREAPAARAASGARQGIWSLLKLPGLGRLLVVNWLLSASWDLHSFLVPVLGHERGLSASAIGLILGSFAAAVTVVRLVIPLLAHRLREAQVLEGYTYFPVREAFCDGMVAGGAFVPPPPRSSLLTFRLTGAIF
jgi:MFS family permease